MANSNMYYRSKYNLKGRIYSIHYSLVYKSFRSKHPILSLGMCPENLVPGQFPISLFRSKRFVLIKRFKRKAAKFEIFYVTENPYTKQMLGNQTNYMSFLMHKILQILKHFAGIFC